MVAVEENVLCLEAIVDEDDEIVEWNDFDHEAGDQVESGVFVNEFFVNRRVGVH